MYKLFVRQDVGNGPTIVLLHGIFADGTQWQTITRLLQGSYRVIVVDLLGHGKSPRSNDISYTPDEHADALRATLESINATKKITLVGYSMGGNVALSYCAKYQEDIFQLYLISAPFYLNPDEMIASKYSVSVVFTKFSQWFYRITGSMLGPGKLLHKFVSYADNSKIFHKMIGANDNKLDPRIIDLNLKNMIGEFEFASKLKDLNIPVTFYVGKKDLFIVQGQLNALKNFCPHIEIERLDIIKVDHMLVQNLPKEIVSLISANKIDKLKVRKQVGVGEDLVLLHGIESSSDYWTNLIPALAENYRVTTVDLLGFGLSPKPLNIPYSLDNQVQYLNNTLQAMNINKFIIAGHSLGSLVALAYSAKYPEKVTSITLFSPVLIPNNYKSQKPAISLMQKIKLLPDNSYIYNEIANLVGYKRINNFIPSLRSIKNSIQKQNSIILAKKASDVRADFYYGTLDPLIDSEYLNKVAKIFKNSTVNKLSGKTHNFPIFNPEITIKALGLDEKITNKPKATSFVPAKLFNQLYRLAIPVLTIKAVLFLSLGLLLFSYLAGVVLVLGLAFYTVIKGYKIIKGSFSLKYEGLSYLGYFILGVATILIGYGLIKHPDLSLKITIYIISALFTITGALRLLVAVKWTKSPKLKKSLLISGVLMFGLGITSILGSLSSVYIIVYSIALLLIIRGLFYFWYVFLMVIMSYIRGFNNE